LFNPSIASPHFPSFGHFAIIQTIRAHPQKQSATHAMIPQAIFRYSIVLPRFPVIRDFAKRPLSYGVSAQVHAQAVASTFLNVVSGSPHYPSDFHAELVFGFAKGGVARSCYL
jgi:hypothetical protein